MNLKFSILVEKFGKAMRSRKLKKKERKPKFDECAIKEIKTKGWYFGSWSCKGCPEERWITTCLDAKFQQLPYKLEMGRRRVRACLRVHVLP